MDEVTILENEREKNRASIKQLENENLELTAAILKRKWGIAPGVRVVNGSGAVFVVESIMDWGPSKPWITAYPIKKDGIISKKTRHLYSEWELAKP